MNSLYQNMEHFPLHIGSRVCTAMFLQLHKPNTGSEFFMAPVVSFTHLKREDGGVQSATSLLDATKSYILIEDFFFNPIEIKSRFFLSL